MVIFKEAVLFPPSLLGFSSFSSIFGLKRILLLLLSQSTFSRKMATIKVYVTSVFGSTKLRKQQQHVIDILESRNIPFERIDISDPNKEEMRKFMRTNSKARREGQAPLPPQIFHDEDYCGDYESMTNSIETDSLYDFLKLEDPDKDAKARVITRVSGSTE